MLLHSRSRDSGPEANEMEDLGSSLRIVDLRALILSLADDTFKFGPSRDKERGYPSLVV